jgi:hypothetical protein
VQLGLVESLVAGMFSTCGLKDASARCFISIRG